MDQNMNLLTRRRFVEQLMATGVVAVGSATLGGCAQGGDAGQKGDAAKDEADAGAQAEASIVVDAKGNEFAIPDSVERIAITCNGGTTHEVAIFGAAR